MDPDELLERIRARLSEPVTLDTGAALQWMISDLDGWLSRGGYPPADWTTDEHGQVRGEA